MVLASESHCICGVDVAAPHQLRRKDGAKLADTLRLFKNQLTSKEVCMSVSMFWHTSRLEPAVVAHRHPCSALLHSLATEGIKWLRLCLIYSRMSC